MFPVHDRNGLKKGAKKRMEVISAFKLGPAMFSTSTLTIIRPRELASCAAEDALKPATMCASLRRSMTEINGGFWCVTGAVSARRLVFVART